jgi:hypothetical protein
MTTRTTGNLNALRNPVKYGDQIELSDGSTWKLIRGAYGWSLYDPATNETHPATVPAIDSQAELCSVLNSL